MKRANDTVANNFGLVGKAMRKYLATSALTAAGLAAMASPSFADNWTDHVATEGAIGIDTSIANTTNITQFSDFAKVRGDGDINAGHTVNLKQNSGSSRYVLFDTENDPTQILGNLNANGQVYIFDQNGVIFGAGSQVNVGSIVASSGIVDEATLSGNQLKLDNVGAGGNIVLNGSISVSDAGVAAFVAPSVKNSGVINAKMGNVVLASGNTVTLDMYGDGLVEVAVSGELENALIENKGTIKAEGGNVTLTASAAKDVVDNVINMDGVVDVSSVSVKGGKIILGGGKHGTVKVSGKLDASGKNGGGKIDVTGDNIHVADTAELAADAFGTGNGGDVSVIAQNHTDFRGSILARGGEFGGNGGNAEVSGYGILGYSGFADLSAVNGTFGQLLLDPTFAVIHSGIINNPLGFSYILSAQALANSMKTANVVVQADNYIDVGTKAGAYNTGNVLVDLALNTLVGTGDIDLSTWKKTVFTPFPACLFGCTTTGTTAGSITFDTATLNFNKNLKMGDGNIAVDADVVNLNGLLNDKTNTLLGDARISSNAGIVNVLSNAGKIQQGIWLSKDSGGGTVNVGSGTYNESITVDRFVKLYGANAGIDPNTGARVAETIVDPNSPGFLVTASNTVIDGFTITSADDGILVNGTYNVTLKNNIIHDVLESGIELSAATGTKILNNRIDNTGDSAIKSTGVAGVGGDILVDNNYIGQNVGSVIKGNGVFLGSQWGGTVKRNRISNATQIITEDKASGVYLSGTTGTTVGGALATDGNIIDNSDWDGIKIKGGANNTARNNTISNSTRVGIYSEASNNLKVWDNTITNSNIMGGVGVLGGQTISILRNTISNSPTSTSESGIEVTKVTGGDNRIANNYVSSINGYGINVNKTKNIKVTGNHVWDTNNDGITLVDDKGTIAVNENTVGKADGSSKIEGNGISLVRIYSGNVLRNNVYHTHTTNYTPPNGNGILLKDSANINVGTLGNGNYIRNANWDGIKVDGGWNNKVVGNDIADSTRVGVYGTGGTDLYIGDNLVRNSHLSGIGYEYGKNITINHNDIATTDTDGDGVYVNSANGNIRITNNTIDDSADDGIEVVDSAAYTYIAGNTITNSGFSEPDAFGGDGIHVRNVVKNFSIAPNVLSGDAGNGEYNIVVYNNSVTNSADDGIEVLGPASEILTLSRISFKGGTGRVLVQDNTVLNSGYGFDYGFGDDAGNGADGIHVANIYDYSYAEVGEAEEGFYGYAVDVLHNNVTNSGDDGIEVVDSSSTLIDDNTVTNSGLVYIDSEDDEVFAKISEGGDTGDYLFGADGIHVRNVWSVYNEPSYVTKISGGSYEGGFTPYSVVVRRNNVSNSVDDGIQVLFSGDTLIDSNVVQNSGSDAYPRLFGGDGINVVAGINPFEDNYYYYEGYYPYIEEVNVTVSNNEVSNSLDDGIEVVGSNNVLIDTNDVSDSGDDGINILGFAGYYGDEYEMVSEKSLAYIPYYDWPYFEARVVNNTVIDSGNDGIESRGFDDLTVLSNDVTNSLANGLYVSGFNNGYSYVADNTFTDNDIGAQFESGVVDLTGESNTFNGGRVGLRFAPYAFGGGEEPVDMMVAFSLPSSIYDYLFPYPFMTPSSGFAPLSLVDDDGGPNSPSFPVVPPTNYGGTIGAQIFNGQSQYYVELDNGAFFEPGTPTWLNGLNSIYDGILPTSFAGNELPQTVYDNIESKIFHFVDRGDLGLFFFGLRSPDVVDINENLIFNQFNTFNGDITGLNVRILGLPNIPGGGAPVQNFNNINTFAGGDGNTPGNLNDIQTAAGGDGNQGAGGNGNNLNNIDTQAGGNSERCWSSAANAAGGGQAVSVVYSGSIDDNLAQAEACAGTI